MAAQKNYLSFLGGSKVQIGGPTGAFVIIIYSIIQEYGLNGLDATFSVTMPRSRVLYDFNWILELLERFPVISGFLHLLKI